ncbi:MAG: hypothetical protein KC457_17040, partial [Myxococcales bacterium]|nr:hypothetical protein [Myxococcales bacterium]
MSALPWTLLGLPADFELPHLELTLAGDDALAGLDGGRVSKPETINVRSCRGEVGGLFDEAIFGALFRDPANADSPRLDLLAERDGLPGDEQPAEPHPRRDRFGYIELVEPM